MLRLYLNAFESGRLWQVDNGNPENATQWDGVEIGAAAWTNEDLSKRGSETEPCCWIECRGLLREIKGRDGKYAVIEDAG